MTFEDDGTRMKGRPRQTWWDCVTNDMESFRLSQNDQDFLEMYC